MRGVGSSTLTYELGAHVGSAVSLKEQCTHIGVGVRDVQVKCLLK